MRPNPYALAAQRFFLIVLETVGFLLFGSLALRSLLAQEAPGISRSERLFETTYDAASNPSQFWFYVVLFTALSALFAALAWRSYRGGT